MDDVLVDDVVVDEVLVEELVDEVLVDDEDTSEEVLDVDNVELGERLLTEEPMDSDEVCVLRSAENEVEVLCKLEEAVVSEALLLLRRSKSLDDAVDGIEDGANEKVATAADVCGAVGVFELDSVVAVADAKDVIASSVAVGVEVRAVS